MKGLRLSAFCTFTSLKTEEPFSRREGLLVVGSGNVALPAHSSDRSCNVGLGR